ncbi:mitochondrial RNA pseudouridine synthase Rpusd4-like isoform X2 [Pomacea canaliculata]|nr:mitochondrial RNA pseudouridine synthase Rpusd4-like isoform X2 [Pomacea canaliculata]
MLLAKSAEVSWQLLGMFRRREVKKIYWTITKGLPQPHEGVIDVPLARQKINDVYKTVIKPEKRVVGEKMKTLRDDDKSSRAVTQYKVLAHRDSMALVECIPQTGFQHQIRAHLAQGMNSPVLGDHKYSHFDRLAPQKLFPEALQKLNLRQAQVRYLPMHLHAKALVLPEWRGDKNVFIKAKVPKYFLKNLATLKIKIPHN